MEGRYYRKKTGSDNLRRRLKSNGFIIGSLVAVPVLFYIVFGSHGIIQRIELENRISTLEEKIKVAEIENERLKEVAKALDSDMKAIEKVAREKYAMARQGETVYRIKSEVESRKAERGTRNE